MSRVLSLLLLTILPLPAAAGEPRRDLYGDPLPEGALVRFGTIQRRLLGPTQLAITKDGKTLVGITGGRYVRFWDTETLKLKEQFELPGVGADRNAILGKATISPDGTLAVTGKDESNSLYVWDLQNRKIARTIAVPRVDDNIVGVLVSPDTTKLAVVTAGSKVPRVRFAAVKTDIAWDAEVAFLKDDGGFYSACSFSPDGGSFVASFASGHLVCWDSVTGKVRWHKPIYAPGITFFPDGRSILASGVSDAGEERLVLSAADGARIESLKLPKRAEFGESIVGPDNRTLLLRLQDEIELWDMKEGRGRAGIPIPTPNHMYPERACVVSTTGSGVTTAFEVLQRWDLKSAKALLPDPAKSGHLSAVHRVVFSRDGKLLASTSDDRSLRLWNVNNGQLLDTFQAKTSWVTSVQFTRDGLNVVAAHHNSLMMWNVAARRCTLCRESPEEWLESAWLSSDGETLIRLAPQREKTSTSSVTRLNTTTGSVLSRVKLDLDDWSREGIAATGSWLVANDGRAFDLVTGQPRLQLETNDWERTTRIIAISLDDRQVAGVTGTFRDRAFARSLFDPWLIRSWESITSRTIFSIKKPREGHILAAFCPDTRMLATADVDGLQVWRIPNGECVLKIPAHQQFSNALHWIFATALAWSPDGKALATGHPDGTILLWDMSKLPRPARRALTYTECDIAWGDLAAPEPAKAYAAIFRMVDDPAKALPWLREKLKPAAALAPAELRALINDLGEADFKKRDAADKRLRRRAELAEGALREMLKTNPPAEQRNRLQAILDTLAPMQVPHPEILREIRAVAVLEYIGTTEARKFLEELAAGAEGARLTREAKETLARVRAKNLGK